MEQSEIKRWHEEVLQEVLLTENDLLPPAELPGGGLALLSADTDRTQGYVFQSARLPEIRGASMLLDRLNRDGLLGILAGCKLSTKYIDDKPPGCVIFNGGGSLLAMAPAKLADELVTLIETLYPEKTGTATITAVARPISVADARAKAPATFDATQINKLAQALNRADRKRVLSSYDLAEDATLEEGTFAQVQGLTRVMRQQTLTLRRRKQARKITPLVEANPFARLCRSCGRRPAARYFRYAPGEPGRYLCQICSDNGRRGSSADKGYWRQKFEEYTGIDPGSPAKDLAEVGDAWHGYIGFVYADGNSIGRFLETSDSFLSYRERSRKLVAATESAVFAALQTHLYDGQRMLPFEIITIGGDDVLLIAPAHAALPVAHDICDGFSKRLEDVDGKNGPPTMSAGVVLAHQSNPIYFLSDLAKKLLNNAKRRTHETKKAHLDFMTLKSQSTIATDLQDVRTSPSLLAESEPDQERCFLTGRPYTLAGLDRLLQNTRELKTVSFSPGQLHEMRQNFQHGRFPGLFHYLYQRARLRREHRQILADIEQEWGMVEPKGAPPWRYQGRANDDYEEYDTPLLDMLELREFV